MLSHKKLVRTGLLCMGIALFTACGTAKTDDKTDNKTDNKTDADLENDNSANKTDLLYMDALKGLSINDDKQSDKAETGKTYDVKKGLFEKNQSVLAHVCYEDLDYASIEANEAEVVSFEVEEGDIIKKGDVILNYKCVYDEAEQKQKELDVQNMEKEYLAGYHSRQAEINFAEHELSMLKSKTEKEIKRLEIQKLKHSLQNYEAMKKKVTEAKQELAEYTAGNKSGTVKAPSDGYIITLNKPEEDSNYMKDQVVAVISAKEKFHIEAEDLQEDGLRYGSNVTVVIEGKGAEEDVEIPGIVESANNIQSSGKMQGSAYIRLTENVPDVNWENTIKVNYQNVTINDAIIVPKEAVQMESDAGSAISDIPYVYVYKNDVPQKRYIKIADENNMYYRVAEGITEGDKLVVFN